MKKYLLILLAALPTFAIATTIDNYPAASTPLVGTERMPGNQGANGCAGCTVKITTQSIADLVTKTSLGLNNVTNDAQTKAAIVPNTVPTAGQLLVGNVGGTAYAPVSMGGDCTMDSAGVITCSGGGGIVDQTFTADATVTMPGYFVKFDGARSPVPGIDSTSNCKLDFGAGAADHDSFKCDLNAADSNGDGPYVYIEATVNNQGSSDVHLDQSAGIQTASVSAGTLGRLFLDQNVSFFQQNHWDDNTPANNHVARISLAADASASSITITGDSMTFNSMPVLPAYRGVTGSISGALTAGTCDSDTVSIAAATTSMAVSASPETYPGDGAVWMAYVSAPGIVTVKLCGLTSMTPTASVYNVVVNP